METIRKIIEHKFCQPHEIFEDKSEIKAIEKLLGGKFTCVTETQFEDELWFLEDLGLKVKKTISETTGLDEYEGSVVEFTNGLVGVVLQDASPLALLINVKDVEKLKDLKVIDREDEPEEQGVLSFNKTKDKIKLGDLLNQTTLNK